MLVINTINQRKANQKKKNPQSFKYYQEAKKKKDKCIN